MNVAVQVQAEPAPAPSFAPVRTHLLQRKCACGGTPGPDGECAQCRKKRLQQHSTGQVDLSTVPPIVKDVLRSPGQLLDPAIRTLIEPRFGHDFSAVPAFADESRDALPSRPAALMPTMQTATRLLYRPPLSSQAPGSTGGLETQQALDLAQQLPYQPYYPKCFEDSIGYCLSIGEWHIENRNKCECTKSCTQEHEDQHRRDFGECCKAWRRAENQPGANKAALAQAWEAWRKQVQPISECRAYMNDIYCAQRQASIKGCVPMRDQTGEARLLAWDGATATGGYETLTEGIAQKATLDSAADLETLHGAGAKKPSTDFATGLGVTTNTGVEELSACCREIDWYEQTFAGEAYEWCAKARGKPIPPCPFTATPKKP